MAFRIPMATLLTLARRFDPDNKTLQQAIALAAARIQTALGRIADELTPGQIAALIDHLRQVGLQAFLAGPLPAWLIGGNFAKPMRYLRDLGRTGDLRATAQRDVWNLGADAPV